MCDGDCRMERFVGKACECMCKRNRMRLEELISKLGSGVPPKRFEDLKMEIIAELDKFKTDK